MTGRELGSGERLFAAGFVIFTLGTVGVGNAVSGVLKEVATISSASLKELAEVKKITINASTVWDSIRATQEFYNGTVLPKSFEMTLQNGSKVWVAPNGSKHINQFVASVASHGASVEQVKLATQFELSSLKGALDVSLKEGIKYNEIYTKGGWEIIVGPPRQPGGLPAVFHALNKMR